MRGENSHRQKPVCHRTVFVSVVCVLLVPNTEELILTATNQAIADLCHLALVLTSRCLDGGKVAMASETDLSKSGFLCVCVR